MDVQRVERHIIDKNHRMFNIIDEYCFKSKNLYNYANYIILEKFKNEDVFLKYTELSKQIKHDKPFKEIGSNSAQMTLKLLEQNWKSYIAAIKDWGKNKHKYLGKPNMPRYLPKDGRYVWILTNWQSQIKEGYLYFVFKPLKQYNNLVRTKINEKHLQTRFIPRKSYYIMEIVYKKQINNIDYSNLGKRILGIDLGLNRFVTTQNNIGMIPFAINGGEIKAINNYYNKQVKKYLNLAKQNNNLHWTKRLEKLTTKRYNKIENFLHKASKYIVEHCIAYGFDTVVIGYNKNWKQEANMGKITQHFVYIPYYRFVEKLEYKLLDNGIKLIKTEESYTSKASFLDHDELKYNDSFSGKRIYRGLYETKDGFIINADVNGAGNIIRKVFPNAFADGIKGVHLHPKIINL